LNLKFLGNRDFLRYWLPPLAWCGLILVISGDLGSARNTGSILKWLLSWFPPLSQAHFDLLHFYIRKGVGHFGNYGFLYFLWFRAIRMQRRYPSWRAFLCALGLCLALALLDEGHQSLFASRTGSLKDVPLDLSGAATMALLISLFWTPRMETPAVAK
jgi:VanZ family protein